MTSHPPTEHSSEKRRRKRQRYWDYYAALQDDRAGPSDESASRLRLEFDELFSTQTGYDALDDRIAKTSAKRTFTNCSLNRDRSPTPLWTASQRNSI